MSTQIRGNKQIKNITIENDQLVNGTVELNKLKEGAELVKRDGSVPLTGNLNANNNKIVNVAAGVDPNDVVNKAQLDAVQAQVGGTLITREILSGTKNGTNTQFTLAEEPTLGTEQIFFNGILLNVGANADYVITGQTVTFAIPPQPNDSILANYVVDAIQLNVDVQATINQLNGRITTAEAEIALVEASVTSLQAADVSLDARLDAAEIDITTLETRATNIESDITALENVVDAEETRATNAENLLDSRITSAELEIVQAKNRITAAEGDIDDLEAADVVMDGRVSVIEDALQAETNARTNAVNALNVRVTALENTDTDVDSRLDALESDVSDLQADLTTETNARALADGTLQSNINLEIANRVAAVSGVQNNLNTEIADRVSGDSALQSELDATQVGSGLGASGAYSAHSIANYIKPADFVSASLTASLHNADKLIDSALKAEVDARIALDARVEDLEDSNSVIAADYASITYVNTQISNLVNSAPAVLDTLKELADAIGGDANFAATLAGQVGAVDDRVDGVVSDISALQTEVDAIEAGAGLSSSGTYSAHAASNYITDAKFTAASLTPSLHNADKLLDAELKAFADAAVLDFEDLYDQVEAEQLARTNADSALDVRVTALENEPDPVVTLNGLSDVVITTPSNGQVLKYNGTEWINSAPPSTFSGSYNDLTNKPDLSVYALNTTLDAVDTRVEALENNAFITREVPSGAINGLNALFTLANVPVLGSEQVFVNGILQEPGEGNDYTISSNIITFAVAPLSHYKIHVNYATGNYMVAPGNANSGAEIYQDAEFAWNGDLNVVGHRTITHNKGRRPDIIKVFIQLNGVWWEHYDLQFGNGNHGWFDLSYELTPQNAANQVKIGLFRPNSHYNGVSNPPTRIRLFWFSGTDVGTASSTGGWIE